MKSFLNMLFAPFILAKAQLDRLGAPFITEEGQRVLQDPEKMEKVRKAIDEHSASRKHGPIIVEFED